ncbi:MAG: hypothetical protein ACKOC9_14400, partial [Alphaproteobacteria bacterium]
RKRCLGQPGFQRCDFGACDFLCAALGDDPEAQEHQQNHHRLRQAPKPTRGALAAFPAAFSAQRHL